MYPVIASTPDIGIYESIHLRNGYDWITACSYVPSQTKSISKITSISEITLFKIATVSILELVTKSMGNSRTKKHKTAYNYQL